LITSAGHVGAAAALQVLFGKAGHNDGDVAGALPDADAAPTGTGTPALLGGAVVGEGPHDEKLVLGDLFVVLRVGDRGVQELPDFACRGTLAEMQRVSCRFDVLASDQVQDHADLRGGDRNVAEPRQGFAHRGVADGGLGHR
jgi:hypothetical protein